tara:strand:- start:55642 stop:56310 length:669 start_codon:yes stop_codon:yes gene_type:complete
MKICIGVQARLSSKRLPGKVLKKIGRKKLLDLLIERLEKTSLSEHIFLLTSNRPSDDLIENYCIRNKIKYFRGDLNNVFGRYKNFLENFKYDAIVRISADSPLIEPKLIEDMIEIFKNNKKDIVTNVFPKSFPNGQSVEIISSHIFRSVKSENLKKDEKEHVTKHFYKNFLKYNILNFKCPYKHKYPKLTIDTIDDFIKLEIFIKKKHNLNNLSINDILKDW